MYVIFRITPYSKNIARSLLKSPKIYFFDTGIVLGDEGARLENFISTSLLKSCYATEDYLAEEIFLYYISTKENREVGWRYVAISRPGTKDPATKPNFKGKSLIIFALTH